MTLGLRLIYIPTAPTMPTSFRSLPDRVQTLVRWGGVPRRYLVRRKTPLPIRTPGASLALNPAPTTPVLHWTPLLRPRHWWSRFWDPIVVWWWKKVNEFSVLESDETFARWWSDYWVDDRKRRHHGQHRVNEVDDVKWREEWAKYDTQWWPTLSTTGDAWDIEALDVRPMICTTGWDDTLIERRPMICDNGWDFQLLMPPQLRELAEVT